MNILKQGLSSPKVTVELPVSPTNEDEVTDSIDAIETFDSVLRYACVWFYLTVSSLSVRLCVARRVKGLTGAVSWRCPDSISLEMIIEFKVDLNWPNHHDDRRHTTWLS